MGPSQSASHSGSTAYQWQFADGTAQLHEEFAERALDKADEEFFLDILKRMIKHSDELDQMLTRLLDRPLTVGHGRTRCTASGYPVELSERIDILIGW